MQPASPNRQRIAPRIQRNLILDPNAATARLIMEFLRSITPCDVAVAATREKGQVLAKALDPQIIFVEHASGGVDGLEFTRWLRRSDLKCRKAAVIMVTAEATAAAILGARDAGVHEFLRKPFTFKDLEKRLEAVSLGPPRGWVEAVQYVGPDRRRFNSAAYSGPGKRRSDVKRGSASEAAIQALKIVRSAPASLETDPAQVRRSLAAQAVELQKAAISSGDLKLLEAVRGLQRWIDQYPQNSPAAAEALARCVAALVVFLPKDEPAKAA